VGRNKERKEEKMHSTLVRIQNVFGFFTTVAFFVAGLVALSSLLYPADVSVDVIKTNDVKMYDTIIPSFLHSFIRVVLALMW